MLCMVLKILLCSAIVLFYVLFAVYFRWSEGVFRGSISLELSTSLSSEHHIHGAGAICMLRWTCHDLDGA